MGMSNESYRKYLSYIDNQAKMNDGIREGGMVHLSVNPAVQQRLEKAKMESSPFLKEINSFGVVAQEGEKVTGSVRGPIASTNTSNKDRREPQQVHDEVAERYRCEQTNWDTYISYSWLDAWAEHPEFQKMISALIAEQEANDRLMIGFNGVKRAARSDKTANPLLQDVNVGWLQKIRERASQRVMNNVTLSSFNETGDLLQKGMYSNREALVFDAVNSLLDPWHRRAKGLIVITGYQMYTQDNFKILNQHSAYSPNMELLAGHELLRVGTIGGIPSLQVPFFPDGTMLITTLKNLSVYWQKGAYRRTIKDEPEYNRIATYSSGNEGYVVEDYGLACLIEGIHYAHPESETTASVPSPTDPSKSIGINVAG